MADKGVVTSHTADDEKAIADMAYDYPGKNCTLQHYQDLISIIFDEKIDAAVRAQKREELQTLNIRPHVNVPNKQNFTALTQAVYARDTELVVYLTDNGAKPFSHNNCIHLITTITQSHPPPFIPGTVKSLICYWMLVFVLILKIFVT